MLWLAYADNRVSASNTISRLELDRRRTSLLCCNFPCNCFVSDQIGLKRESHNNNNNKKSKPEQKQGGEAAAEFHATANISLLAC